MPFIVREATENDIPARIRAFFLHPAYARRSIGRRLIEFCESAARASGFRNIELGATSAGKLLYAALGDQVTDRESIPNQD